jgi:hypothetical protein
LTSRAAAGASVLELGSQLVSRTCGSVVEVLVDKLAAPLAMAPCGSSSRGAKTYVVRGLGDVAERRRRELGDDLLDLDVFSHNGGLVGDAMEDRGVFWGWCCWLEAKLLEKSRQGSALVIPDDLRAASWSATCADGSSSIHPSDSILAVISYALLSGLGMHRPEPLSFYLTLA